VLANACAVHPYRRLVVHGTEVEDRGACGGRAKHAKINGEMTSIPGLPAGLAQILELGLSRHGYDSRSPRPNVRRRVQPIAGIDLEVPGPVQRYSVLADRWVSFA
jgi:hypothetical protein